MSPEATALLISAGVGLCLAVYDYVRDPSLPLFNVGDGEPMGGGCFAPFAWLIVFGMLLVVLALYPFWWVGRRALRRLRPEDES